jgi:hypothetical protein
MLRWDSTQISIGDILDLKNSNRLELRPNFQRQEVWTEVAKVMLIDSILKNIPIPKFYIRREVRGGATFRAVIDGQQRFRAILDFMDNKFALKSPPCEAHLHNKKFIDLEEVDKEKFDQFINYRIDMNEITSATDDEVRQMYSRVNKYMKPLTKQELRRADFPGNFLSISEGLALSEILEEFKIFTPANRRRMADVEFVSELLALIIREAPLDKKEQLDTFYDEFANWAEPHRGNAIKHFQEILNDCKTIFDGETLPTLDKTRFRQKSDFYGLFGAISSLQKLGGSLAEKELLMIRKDLVFLDAYIKPSSHIEMLKDYAIRCVSDANSASSRRWRIDFLKNIMAGTYLQEASQSFQNIAVAILYDKALGGSSSTEVETCAFSKQQFSPTLENSVVGWFKDNGIFQISNAQFILRESIEKNDLSQWLIVDPLMQPESEGD